MPRRFNRDGVSFRYPDGWTLDREEGEDGWAVSVQSPGTAFALISLDRGQSAPEDVAAAALEALKGDYPDLEAEACVTTLAGQMAVGHDINFFSLDLTISCWTRSLYCDAGTLLVLCQVGDVEEESYEPALRAVCASLSVEEG
jgi:hypothetical protein